MGTYLVTGIVREIKVSKRDVAKNVIPEYIEKALSEELDVACYVYAEEDDDGGVSWHLKPEMLEGNFAEFLEAQFKMYNDEEDIREIVAKIREAKTGEKIIDLACQGDSNFQMVNDIYHSIKVSRDGGWSDYITAKFSLIAFFIDGKIIMESYGDILGYFEKNIRLQAERYPVVKCLKVMISS
jgi:hypothetical protein